MPTKSIAVPDAIYDRVQEVAAAEGTTVDQLATKAIERDLARRSRSCSPGIPVRAFVRRVGAIIPQLR